MCLLLPPPVRHYWLEDSTSSQDAFISVRDESRLEVCFFFFFFFDAVAGGAAAGVWPDSIILQDPVIKSAERRNWTFPISAEPLGIRQKVITGNC